MQIHAKRLNYRSHSLRYITHQTMAVTFTEVRRVSYVSYVVTLNWINILLSLALAPIAIYMYVQVRQASRLLAEYNDKTLSVLLMAISGLCCGFNLISAAIWFVSAYPRMRRGTLMFLLLTHFLSVCVCSATIAGAIFAFIHTSSLAKLSLR